MITRIQEKCQIIFHLSTALAGYLWEFTLRNSDWFIALFALIVIDQSNDFGIGIYIYIIQLSPKGEVNSGGYIPRREASRYISTALHRP